MTELSDDEKKLLEGVLDEAPRKQFPTFFVFLILFFLCVSYFLFGPWLYSIFESRIESQSFENYETTFKDWKILFSENVFLSLQQLYFAEQRKEFSVCLLGKYENNTYFVDDLYLPFIFFKSFNQVGFGGCPTNTIIQLHTHPYKQCIFSDQDIETYQDFAKSNSNILISVMCEPNRFGFYRQ